MDLGTGLFVAAAAVSVLVYVVWAERAERSQRRLLIRVDDALHERRMQMILQRRREQGRY